jgi:stage V sporulation protein R
MMAEHSAPYAAQLEQLARQHGLDFYPVEFDVVPPSFMLEIAVYGLPVRMPHWSFGVRYIHQLVRQNMGHSHIYEVMFPGNPCRAFMANTNSAAENALVTAHVIGHADFARNNALFARFMDMAGGHILEQSAARAHRLQQAVLQHGQRRVEAILDAALALEAHVDINQPLHRPPYPAAPPLPKTPEPGRFQRRYHLLPGERAQVPAPPTRPAIPPHPEADLLWFMAQYAPDLADWERDILLAVREEAFYFYPVHACQIMNEGWASYWHARLLREADFLPHAQYLQAIKAHSDVVRPFGGSDQLSLSINPYHLGFRMWERIIERDGMAAARRICAEEDDFGFVRNYLDQELADELDLFVYETFRQGETRVLSRDIRAVREAILSPRYNYGAPCIAVERMQDDYSLVLRHDHQRDGRGLDLLQAERVMEYVSKVWQRPLVLHTVDFRGVPRTVTGKAVAG